MKNMHLKIANKIFSVFYYYEETYDICIDFIVDSVKPDIIITITKEELDSLIMEETSNLIPKQTDFEKSMAVMLNYSSYESHLLLKKIADALLSYGILLIHGAAITVDKKCYIFTAPSGVGKTTHILNWINAVPGVSIVNGDKPFLDILNYKVYSSPWCGKEGLGENISAHLSGIVYLERCIENRIEPVSLKEILPILFQQIYIPRNRELAIKAFQLFDRFRAVSFYHLFCNMDTQSAIVSYKGLIGGKDKNKW